MSDVALAGCAGKSDPDLSALIGALDRTGVTAHPVSWDDAGCDWGSFDATVIRSTWDYVERLGEFLAWARAVPRLVNPAGVVEWSSDKRYLDVLAASGVATIETSYPSSGALAALPDGDVVVKPTVGAGSRGVARFAVDEHDLARAHVDDLVALGHRAMVQPHVTSIEREGETDVIVIDGTVSHAVRKHVTLSSSAATTPAGADHAEPVEVTDAQAAVVHAALAAVPFDGPLCFARVDLAMTPAGPAVVELELVEPFLFLSGDPGAPDRLAAAIAARVRH